MPVSQIEANAAKGALRWQTSQVNNEQSQFNKPAGCINSEILISESVNIKHF